jgi:hypothetical protein
MIPLSLTIIIWQTTPIVCHMFWAPFLFCLFQISFALYCVVGLFWNRSLYACSCLSVCLLSLVATRACLCGLGIWPQECYTGFHSRGFLLGPNFVHLGFLRYYFFSLSFFLRLLSVPCPDLECILVWPSFLFQSWEVLLIYVLIGRRTMMMTPPPPPSLPAGMQAISVF